jgi:hypothetical protein
LWTLSNTIWNGTAVMNALLKTKIHFYTHLALTHRKYMRVENKSNKSNTRAQVREFLRSTYLTSCLTDFFFLVLQSLTPVFYEYYYYYFKLIWSEKTVNLAKIPGATSRKRNLQGVAGFCKYTRNIEPHDVNFGIRCASKLTLSVLDLRFSQR